MKTSTQLSSEKTRIEILNLLALPVTFIFHSLRSGARYNDGIENELARVEPRILSLRLPLSLVLFLSALGLLPELLFESETKVVFWRTPVGENSD